MSDLSVRPELIDLHHSLARMVKLIGADVVSADGYERWAGQSGHAMLVFTKDPERSDVPLDLANLVSELRATAGGSLRIGLLPPTASAAMATRLGLKQWPVFVMLRDGKLLGVVEDIRDWDMYTAELLQLLAAESGPLPTIPPPPSP